MFRLVYLALALLPGVLSQTTTSAFCTVTSLSWTFNSLGDSPCQVAADLAGVCNGGVFDLKPLDDGFVYLGPTVAVQNSCRCSSVYYSMLSACAACQGRDWLDWSEYDGNCTTIYPGVFLQPIPAGTRVPGWAYADVRVTGTFNVSVAESLDSRPESTGAASPTGSSVPTSRTSPSLGTTSRTASSSGATSSQSNGSSGSNAGAIAGGVIGGVVGLALIGGIAFFFLRRRRQSSGQPPSSAFNTTPYMAAPHNPDQNMSYNPSANPFTPVAPAQQNLYDPSDPSTFPTSPAPVSPYTNTYTPPPQSQTYSSFQGSATQVGPHPQMPMPGPAPTGHYTGAPEL